MQQRFWEHFNQTANAAKTAKLARAMPKANAAVLQAFVELETIFVAPVARRPSEPVTATLEAFRLMANAAKTAKPVRAIPRANVVQAAGFAAKTVLSAVQAASLPLVSAIVAPEVSAPTESAAVRTAKPVTAILKANAVLHLGFAVKTVASAAQAANLPSALAILALEASQLPASVVARVVRHARATQRANVAVKVAFAAPPLISAPPAARALLANAIPALTLSRRTGSVVARMDASAKAMLMENAAVNRVIVALRLLSVVLVAKMHSVFAIVGQALYQQTCNAPRMARPARALPMVIAAL